MIPDLSRIITSVLVEIISEKIVERLSAMKRKALVLFDLSDYGLGDAIQQLNKLHGDGWSLEIAGTNEALGAIPSTFPGQALAVPQLTWNVVDAASPMSALAPMLSRNTLLILPNLSQTSAAKVANGIADDVPSRAMVAALEAGKKIVVGKNGCCPACRDRDGSVFLANDAYRSMMISNLEKLDAFGVQLSLAPKLSEVVNRSVKPLMLGPQSKQSAQGLPVLKPQTPKIATAESKSVFGWRDAKFVSGSTVNLAQSVIITPLALEELRARNISVIRH
nr:hypothetical protein [uncultured Cohaesibacter sp.]